MMWPLLALAALILIAMNRPGPVGRVADRAFAPFFVVYTAAAVVWLVTALLPFAARVSPAVGEQLAHWGGGERTARVALFGDDDGSVRVEEVSPASGRGIALVVGEPVTITIDNRDEDRGYEVGLFARGTTAALAESGAVAAGTSDELTVELARPGVYELRGLDRGTAPLRFHAVDGPPRLGPLSRAARGAAAEALASESDYASPPSPLLTTMDYLFSLMNIALAVVLLRLQPGQRTARLLAVGMVGTGAVFNAQAHTTLGVFPGFIAFHELFHILGGAAYVFAVALFPDGSFKPHWNELPAWRQMLRIVYLIVAPMFALTFITSTHGGDPTFYVIIFGVLVPLVGLSSQVFRYRHAHTVEERQQSRLLVTTLTAAIAGAATLGLLSVMLSGMPSEDARGLQPLVFRVFPVLFAALPLALFAILVRYRLWNVDRIVNRAFVFGALASFISVVYVAVVVVVGVTVGERRWGLPLSVLATAIVAVGFQPLRERVQALANRLVYGRRASPYELLAHFSDEVAETYAPEDVLPRVARVLAEGTSAARADVWLVVGSTLFRAASWPESDDAPERAQLRDGAPDIEGVDRVAAVRHRGELLGALTVVAAHGEVLAHEEDRLLDDLAAQAGLVLRNVLLTQELRRRLDEISAQADELRASRQRIVAAQDAERRRMERDIHDGAQQHLVALAVKLRLARTMTERDPERARVMVDELGAEVGEALDTLRNLARGIYPAILSDAGLVAALESHAERVPLEVRVDAVGLGRYPPEVENAVYFCCLEGLQNAAKYARPNTVVVRLEDDGGELRFTVRDDGVGFDPAVTAGGRGLQNIADRLAALDGSFEVQSHPGRGTTVEGRVPLRTLEPVS